MIDAKELRTWLLMRPRPVLLRVQDGEGGSTEVKAPRGGQSWSSVASTVCALLPAMVEAFDADGSLIRAMRDGDGQAEPAQGEDVDVPPALATDPETARLTHFANLLYRSHRFATEVAFEKMTTLFERLDARSAGIEQRLERTESNYRRVLQQQVDDAFDQASEIAQAAQQGQTGDPRTAMMEMFINQAVAGWMTRNPQGPPPPPRPNGNGKGGGKPNGGSS